MVFFFFIWGSRLKLDFRYEFFFPLKVTGWQGYSKSAKNVVEMCKKGEIQTEYTQLQVSLSPIALCFYTSG